MWRNSAIGGAIEANVIGWRIAPWTNEISLDGRGGDIGGFTPHLLRRDLSLPNIPSGPDSHRKTESSHH